MIIWRPGTILRNCDGLGSRIHESSGSDVLLHAVCLQGEVADLKVVGNPRAAERLCDDEDDSDAVSLCLFKFLSVSEPSDVTSSLYLAGLW